jgi:hypothetical protein
MSEVIQDLRSFLIPDAGSPCPAGGSNTIKPQDLVSGALFPFQLTNTSLLCFCYSAGLASQPGFGPQTAAHLALTLVLPISLPTVARSRQVCINWVVEALLIAIYLTEKKNVYIHSTYLAA